MTISAVSTISSPAATVGKDLGYLRSDQFESLVLALKEALGPSSGLTSDDVDVEFLTRLMQQYNSSDMGWSKYAFGDGSRGYTRNLVDEGNGKSNLVSRHSAIYNPLPLQLTIPTSLFSCGRLGKGALSMIMAMLIA